MNATFAETLRALRHNAKLTNQELGRLAEVPDTLIASLQNDNRRVGEFQALKIGRALGLHGEELEAFVYTAIDTCTEKVLSDAKPYPSRLLNLLAVQLKEAGIGADAICACEVSGAAMEKNVTLTLANGGKAMLKTQLNCV